jgi:hypothetical protein
MKIISQDSCCPGRDFNGKSSRYNSKMLPLHQRARFWVMKGCSPIGEHQLSSIFSTTKRLYSIFISLKVKRNVQILP